jgi:alpha-methylacyl-CoA racemase
VAGVIAGRTRDEWVALFDGDDDCVQPVLDLHEAPAHPHHVARDSFVEVDGTSQPAPAPRFSRTPSQVVRRSPYPGEGGVDALHEWGLSDDEIARFT